MLPLFDFLVLLVLLVFVIFLVVFFSIRIFRFTEVFLPVSFDRASNCFLYGELDIIAVLPRFFETRFLVGAFGNGNAWIGEIFSKDVDGPGTGKDGLGEDVDGPGSAVTGRGLFGVDGVTGFVANVSKQSVAKLCSSSVGMSVASAGRKSTS